MTDISVTVSDISVTVTDFSVTVTDFLVVTGRDTLTGHTGPTPLPPKRVGPKMVN